MQVSLIRNGKVDKVDLWWISNLSKFVLTYLWNTLFFRFYLMKTWVNLTTVKSGNTSTNLWWWSSMEDSEHPWVAKVQRASSASGMNSHFWTSLSSKLRWEWKYDVMCMWLVLTCVIKCLHCLMWKCFYFHDRDEKDLPCQFLNLELLELLT